MKENTLMKQITRTRADIWQDIVLKKSQIKRLNSEIQELKTEDLLHSDDAQWFSETEEDVIVSRSPQQTEKQKVGRVNWNEIFMDEDTGKTVRVQRSRVVRVNGEWK